MAAGTRTISRVVGSLLPQTHIMWTVDSGWLDGTGYTWAMECGAAAAPATVLWTKSTGLTGQVGDADTPSLVIDWLTGDLGTLTPGQYTLEITGTSGGKALKHLAQLVITDGVGA